MPVGAVFVCPLAAIVAITASQRDCISSVENLGEICVKVVSISDRASVAKAGVGVA